MSDHSFVKISVLKNLLFFSKTKQLPQSVRLLQVETLFDKTFGNSSNSFPLHVQTGKTILRFSTREWKSSFLLLHLLYVHHHWPQVSRQVKHPKCLIFLLLLSSSIHFLLLLLCPLFLLGCLLLLLLLLLLLSAYFSPYFLFRDSCTHRNGQAQTWNLWHITFFFLFTSGSIPWEMLPRLPDETFLDACPSRRTANVRSR